MKLDATSIKEETSFGNYVFLSFLLLFLLTSCQKSETDPTTTVVDRKSDYKIIKTLPHDPGAFTQGLIMDDGKIIEGTGQKGSSWISVLDPNNLSYDKKIVLDKKYFGEGITILNDKIYQITYKQKIGFVYDKNTYTKLQEFTYDPGINEGWGLTHNGQDLLLSNGSNRIYYIDTFTFKIQSSIVVKWNDQSIDQINELEYYDGYIYANVWNQNYILKIDPDTGEATRKIDLSSIVEMEKSKHSKIDVLNGIAIDQRTGQLIVTGKYWSNFYYISLNEDQE